MDNLYARLGYTLLLVLNYLFLHHQSHFSRIAFTITRQNTLSSIIAHIGRLENHSTFITTGLKKRNKSICINLALCFVLILSLYWYDWVWCRTCFFLNKTTSESVNLLTRELKELAMLKILSKIDSLILSQFCLRLVTVKRKWDFPRLCLFTVTNLVVVI